MKTMFWTIFTALVLATTLAPADLRGQEDESMVHTKKESMEEVTGPEEYFTGKATILSYQGEPRDPSRLTAASVTFEPGARSNWHTHPLGQLLVVTEGKGWTQIEGGERVEINAGDSVWCPPETKHWHGATESTGMTHLAIQERTEGEDGTNVTWLEPVTDAQYLGRE